MFSKSIELCAIGDVGFNHLFLLFSGISKIISIIDNSNKVAVQVNREKCHFENARSRFL